MKREFLMLGKPYEPNKHKIAGFYMSEKLDGIRCFWDGGLSRGIPTTSVPWANTINPKNGQLKTKVKEIATGLWSRYGNPIAAPDWFLNSLPACPLDGELWCGRGGFQKVTSVCKKDVPIDEEWQEVSFAVFGCPNIFSVFSSGNINNANFVKTIDKDDIERWIRNREPSVLEGFQYLMGEPTFAAELANLNAWVDHSAETYFLVRQIKLPDDEQEAREVVEYQKRYVIEQGGEGLILRDPNSVWTPKRVNGTLLKVKGELDDEGVLVGFTSGRQTTKGSKLLGRIGALVLQYRGKRLELSGLTDEEREFANKEAITYAIENPGEEMPLGTRARHFAIGDKITFTYRELTNDGVPKEARYLRKRG